MADVLEIAGIFYGAFGVIGCYLTLSTMLGAEKPMWSSVIASVFCLFLWPVALLLTFYFLNNRYE